MRLTIDEIHLGNYKRLLESWEELFKGIEDVEHRDSARNSIEALKKLIKELEVKCAIQKSLE